jgi:hypothetical protein
MSRRCRHASWLCASPTRKANLCQRLRSSVYRLLKARDLITSPAFIMIKAAEDKSTAPNQLWHADVRNAGITGVLPGLLYYSRKIIHPGLPCPWFAVQRRLIEVYTSGSCAAGNTGESAPLDTANAAADALGCPQLGARWQIGG